MSANLTLIERLKQQQQTEQETIQALAQQQLETFRSELKDTLDSELNTISDAIKASLKATTKEITGQVSTSSKAITKGLTTAQQSLTTEVSKTPWLLLRHRVLIPLATWAVILASLWGVTQYYTRQIAGLKASMTQLEASKAELEKNREDLIRQGYGAQFSTCDGRVCVAINPDSKTYNSTSGEQHEYRILENN
ncbi:hypothetical protein F8V55_22375 [Salmonella enterica]|nr:hypothetical protein [Salmonella enterica]EIJ8194354.1 hypothetical protein [Salmonella enterica]